MRETTYTGRGRHSPGDDLGMCELAAAPMTAKL